MSRAGRYVQIKSVLFNHYRKKKGQGVTVGFIARKLGMKSSTHLRKMIEEVCSQDDQYQILSAGDHHLYRFVPYVQSSFLDRPLLINGKMQTFDEFMKWERAGVQ